MKLDLKKLEDKLDSALEAETNESLTEWITSNKRKAETTNPSKYKKLIRTEPTDRPSGLKFYLDFKYTYFVYFDKGIDKTAKDIVRPL